MLFWKEKTLLFSFIFATICNAKLDNEKDEIFRNNHQSFNSQERLSRKEVKFVPKAGDKNFLFFDKLSAVRSSTVKTGYGTGKYSKHFPSRIRRASVDSVGNVSAGNIRVNGTQQPKPKLQHYCKFEVKSTSLGYECRPVTSWAHDRQPIDHDLIANDTNFRLFHMETISSHGNNQFYAFNCASFVRIMDALKQWNIPENVSTLRLHKQNIIALGQKGFFSLKSSLRHLRLDFNRIAYISERAFEGKNLSSKHCCKPERKACLLQERHKSY